MTSARALYSLGIRAITMADTANTVPATIAIHFLRRFIAPRSSFTVYVRSIVRLLPKVFRTAGTAPR